MPSVCTRRSVIKHRWIMKRTLTKCPESVDHYIMTEAYSKFVSPKVRIDEKSFRLWHPFDGLHPDEVNLYKKYKEQALLHLKRFNRVTNEPFMPPEVFPEG